MKKKEKIPKEKKNPDQKTILKWLKLVIVLCVLIIVVEIVFIGLKIYQRNQNVVSVDTFSSLAQISDGYLGVGSSDFKHSRFNKYTKDYQKAKLVKYDEEKNIVFETAYTDAPYNSYFYDVAETDSQYIAVGSAQYEKEQVDLNVTDGLIVLYNKEGKQEKTIKVEVLDDTMFTTVKVVDDGFIVAGQSIFENMTLGTDDRGGALLIKYDFNGNEVWRANYGGAKSGIFNDFVITNDSIYAVGKDGNRYGLIAKYSLAGERIFAKSYAYTDTIGFSSIAQYGDDFVVVGSKTLNIEADDVDKITSALLLKYDQDGNIIYEKTYDQNTSARFNKVIMDGDSIVVIGHTAKKDEEESTDQYNVFRYSGIFVKYNQEGEAEVARVEEGSRDTYFSDILTVDDTYLIVGQTSSKELGSNNKDYVSFFLTYDKKGTPLKSETVFEEKVFN